jgi:DNA mismatch repair protein MutL
MPIRVLPPLVAARIAAGEVVERPASVAKELLENALDAGARRVAVEVVDGGVTLLRVADDGCGVPAAEVPLAFARHATSKLVDLEDLARLTTLGFRGEALPSIASVAEVSFLTRAHDASAATLLRVRYGEIVEQRPAARAPGTTVTVEDLFGAQPARRKFLKARATEAGHVAQVTTQLALARPDVAFALALDGRTALTTPGSGDARAALAAVYGADVAAALLELPPAATPDGGVQVRGYVSPPGLHRATRGAITLVVNGRVVSARALLYALEEAYHTLLPVGRHPLALLWVAVPPAEVDVNVHPAKQEVRFLRERAVCAAVHRAVQAAVGTSRAIPVVSALASPPEPAPPAPAGPTAAAPAPLWEPAPADAPQPAARPRLGGLRVLGQVALTYITAEGAAGLYLIDQHAAHERVLLEQLRRTRPGGEQVQYLLEPQVVELTAAQAAALRGHLADLAALGFVVEAFGPRALLLRAIPAALRPATIARVLQETCEALAHDAPATDWREAVCLLLACKTAVKAGQLLTLEEMRALLEQLDEAELGHTCAHGRPTAVLLTHGQLEREFGRR